MVLVSQTVDAPRISRMASLRRKIIALVTAAFLVVLAASLYIAFTVPSDLSAARALLSNPNPDRLTTESLQRALSRVREAQDTLGSLPARLLDFVPVAAQNIGAARTTVDQLMPALETTADTLESIEDSLGQGLIRAGRIDLGAVAELKPPLAEQSQAFVELKGAVESSLSGWLVPPLWDRLDLLRREAGAWAESLRMAAEAAELTEAMLGSGGSRIYLIMLINNAELRGSGGILSGVGTVKVSDGRLSLGPFTYYADVADDPKQKISVPPDVERRFTRYNADEAVLVNATATPDVPEAAMTAISAYQTATGSRVDGAILVDPRGLSALLSPEAEILVPSRAQPLTREDFASFVYSDVYRSTDDSQRRRRAATIALGKRALQSMLSSGFGDLSAIRDIGKAIAGGHLRFFSGEPAEQELLTELGASGELTPSTDDSLLVTVQNLGADKLDYWMRRSLSHDCSIRERSVDCRTEVRISNGSPDGLPGYVVQAGKKPYGKYEGYLEFYVPERAGIRGVELDGNEVRFYLEQEDMRTSVGLFFEVEQGDVARATLAYELPLKEAGYSLEVTPQPLPVDATVDIRVDAPSGWSLEGPDGERRGELEFSGRLVGPIRVEAADRLAVRGGLAGIWERLSRFWSEPLF
jgi:hypothetical protein